MGYTLRPTFLVFFSYDRNVYPVQATALHLVCQISSSQFSEGDKGKGKCHRSAAGCCFSTGRREGGRPQPRSGRSLLGFTCPSLRTVGSGAVSGFRGSAEEFCRDHVKKNQNTNLISGFCSSPLNVCVNMVKGWKGFATCTWGWGRGKGRRRRYHLLLSSDFCGKFPQQ